MKLVMAGAGGLLVLSMIATFFGLRDHDFVLAGVGISGVGASLLFIVSVLRS